MAKVDEFRPLGEDKTTLPVRASKVWSAGRMRLNQLSLRNIMIAVIYFAILFWAIARMVQTPGAVQAIVLGVVVGLGLCGLGIWVVWKVRRLSVLGWSLFVVGYLVITLSTTGILSAMSGSLALNPLLIGILIPILSILLILIGSIIYLTFRRRLTDQDSLLWLLRVTADRDMPLAPGVQAFSTQVSGIFEVWAESLARLLGQGTPLPDALDRLPRLVPVASSLLIRMGWESGNLASGLSQAVEARERRLPALRSSGSRIAYLAWIITVGQAIVGLVMYFIVPKFEAIFKDFGIELPEVTRMVIHSSHVVVEYAWLFMLAEFSLIVYLLRVFFGWGNLSVPVFDRLLSRRHSILILRALAVVVEAGRPIAPALDSLARYYPTGWVRKRLGLAAYDANLGIDWTEALLVNGLLSSSDVGVLASAQRAGNLAWALRELAETGERRWGYRLQAWTQILFVAALLVLGAMVFVISVAYFAPLTTLISRLSR